MRMTRKEAIKRFAPRPKWRLERMIHHELTPDPARPVWLPVHQRAARARWRLYRIQQLIAKIARERRDQ
jgi:hypothetical protein